MTDCRSPSTRVQQGGSDSLAPTLTPGPSRITRTGSHDTPLIFVVSDHPAAVTYVPYPSITLCRRRSPRRKRLCTLLSLKTATGTTAQSPKPRAGVNLPLVNHRPHRTHDLYTAMSVAHLLVVSSTRPSHSRGRITPCPAEDFVLEPCG